MPIHDWTRVDAGIFHHFHQRRKQNFAAVRHVSGDRLVAVVDVVSRGYKSGRKRIVAWCDRAEKQA